MYPFSSEAHYIRRFAWYLHASAHTRLCCAQSPAALWPPRVLAALPRLACLDLAPKLVARATRSRCADFLWHFVFFHCGFRHSLACTVRHVFCVLFLQIRQLRLLYTLAQALRHLIETCSSSNCIVRCLRAALVVSRRQLRAGTQRLGHGGKNSASVLRCAKNFL